LPANEQLSSSHTLFLYLLFALLIGFNSMMLIFFMRGGLAWWRHWLVRVLLWQQNLLPWRCNQLLDEATHRIILFRVGGGFRFIHDLFQEYLALEYKRQTTEHHPVEGNKKEQQSLIKEIAALDRDYLTSDERPHHNR
jgi:hypothetical protein